MKMPTFSRQKNEAPQQERPRLTASCWRYSMRIGSPTRLPFFPLRARQDLLAVTCGVRCHLLRRCSLGGLLLGRGERRRGRGRDGLVAPIGEEGLAVPEQRHLGELAHLEANAALRQAVLAQKGLAVGARLAAVGQVLWMQRAFELLGSLAHLLRCGRVWWWAMVSGEQALRGPCQYRTVRTQAVLTHSGRHAAAHTSQRVQAIITRCPKRARDKSIDYTREEAALLSHYNRQGHGAAATR